MDEFYYDGEYVTNRYFGYLANAEQTMEPFYEEGFLVDGYFDEQSVVSSLTAEGSRIRQGAAAVSTTGSMTCAGNVIRAGAAGLSTAFTESCIGGVIKQFRATPRSYAGLQARGFKRYERPLQTEFNNCSFDTIRKFGEYSAQYNGAQRSEFYTDNTYRADDLTIEFWFLSLDADTQSVLHYEDTAGNYLWELTLPRGATSYTPFFRVYTSSGSSVTSNTGINSIVAGEWNFVKVYKGAGSGGATIYVNGKLVAGGASVLNKALTTTRGRLVIGDSLSAVNGFRIDELRLSSGTRSNTTPTGVFVNDSTTKALFHFENNLVDDISEIENGVATLASSFALTSILSGPQRFPATTINAVATVNAAVSVDRGADLSAFTNAALTVNVTRIQQGASAQSADTTVTSSVDKVTGFDSEFTVDTTQTTNAVKSVEANSLMEGFASQLSAVAKIASGIVFDDVISTMSVSAEKTGSGIASVTAETSVNTTAQTILSAVTEASTNTTLSTTISKLTGYSSAFNSATTFTSTAQAAREALAALNSTTTLSIDPKGTIIGYAALMASAGTLTTLISKNQEAQSALSSDTALTASGLLVAQADIDVNSLFAATIAANRTRNLQITTDSVSAQMTVVVANRVVDVPIDVNSTMNVVAVKVTDTGSSVDSTSNQVTVNSRTRDHVSTMDSEVTLSANAFLSGEARADLNVTATMNVVAVKSGEILLQAFTNAALNTNATVLRSATSVQTSTFTQAPVNVLRTRRTAGNFASQTSLLSNLTGSVFATSALTSQFGININTAVLQLDMYVYMIPGESRDYRIAEETREYTIFGETREYEIRR